MIKETYNKAEKWIKGNIRVTDVLIIAHCAAAQWRAHAHSRCVSQQVSQSGSL
jgi:hypothetical protein